MVPSQRAVKLQLGRFMETQVALDRLPHRLATHLRVRKSRVVCCGEAIAMEQQISGSRRYPVLAAVPNQPANSPLQAVTLKANARLVTFRPFVQRDSIRV